jgi:hypothetical protein
MSGDSDRTGIIVICVVLIGLFVMASQFCSKTETRERYWSGKGNEVIEKARRDEIEAWKKVQASTGKDRDEAMVGAQLATEIRKRFETTRERNLGHPVSPTPPNSN